MKICVFCGSSSGNRPIFTQTAGEIGRIIASNNHEIIYGGGKVGLMGALADGALSSGGRVVGVMPSHLIEREISHRGLSELIEVSGMHERKVEMSTRANAFLALPGGAGTLEEIFEQWTWGQLGFHGKPCGFLNIDGYFDSLLAMIERMVEDGFLKHEYRDMLIVSSDVLQVIERFHSYVAPSIKWAPSNLATDARVVR